MVLLGVLLFPQAVVARLVVVAIAARCTRNVEKYTSIRFVCFVGVAFCVCFLLEVNGNRGKNGGFMFCVCLRARRRVFVNPGQNKN